MFDDINRKIHNQFYLNIEFVGGQILLLCFCHVSSVSNLYLNKLEVHLDFYTFTSFIFFNPCTLLLLIELSPVYSKFITWVLLNSRGLILRVTSSESHSVCVKQALNTRRWLVNALVTWHVSYKITTLT